MKTINHPGVPRPTTMTLQTNPMVVWLSKTRELRIKKGDTLKQVAQTITDAWGQVDAFRIAAFWFAIGERQHRGRHVGNFTKHELRTDLRRQYLVR